jgi:hypothetical protein
VDATRFGCDGGCDDGVGAEEVCCCCFVVLAGAAIDEESFERGVVGEPMVDFDRACEGDLAVVVPVVARGEVATEGEVCKVTLRWEATEVPLAPPLPPPLLVGAGLFGERGAVSSGVD